MLLVMLLCVSISVYAKEKLIWLTDDQTELVNYLNDEHVSIGTDTSKLVIKSLLKLYDIDIQLVQVPRINALLISSPNVCTSNRIKSEQRIKENIFSAPVNLFPSIRLYFLDDIRYVQGRDLFKPLLNQKGELISLALLFRTFPELVLGVSKGRSFGKALDSQLNTLSQKNILIRAGIGRYKSLTKMLFKKRIDFLLKFPTELKRELTYTTGKVQISSLAIAHSAKYIVGHIACSQSETGGRVIKHTNKILQQLYRQAKFYQAHSRYLNSGDLANFNRYYQEVYQTPVPLRPPINE